MARSNRVALASALLGLVALLGAASAFPIPKKNGIQVPVEGGLVATGGPRLPKKCDVAIVGAGPGGAYAAYRLILDGKYTSVCLFESQGRAGGRIYTLRNLGSKGDMSVDLGAYRYIDGQHTLTQGIIENLLKLPYNLYDPISQTFRVIKDPATGNNAGYVAFVEGLLKNAVQAGLKLFFNYEVIKVDKATDAGAFPYILSFRGVKKVVRAKSVIFNIPVRPMERLLQASNISVTLSPQNSAVIQSVYPLVATKLYAYYEDAWWQYINKTTGSFTYPASSTPDVAWDMTELPVKARYHDGDQKCVADRNSIYGKKCWGMLMVNYGNDQSYANYSGNGTQGYHSPAYAGAATKWFQDYAVHFETQGANIKPYVVLDATTWQGRELLNKVHTSVVGVHDRAGIEIPAPFKATPPTQVVVTVWDQAVTNVGGAWSHYKKGNQESAPNRVPGAAMAPFTGEALYLANEAWSTISGWAEGSLIMAENVIMKFFGVPKPTYVSPERHDCVMFETYFYNATLCRSSLNPLQSTV